ncbi:histidine decarboxylase [Fistulifera solaris]|uniref:Histidine decarboxylase n=1 Tax=Fistulifera solaris TaxID=1519565 RepID=A0A1Z5KG88_FISSO|nr:histidine decarboxylase [Fistulifera solaris]|eukprot:GAX25324.1 histidine decarboxylase [Fistulifera solaris]
MSFIARAASRVGRHSCQRYSFAALRSAAITDRFKSSLAAQAEVDLEELDTAAKTVDEALPKIDTPTDWSTFNPSKSGTPSPWAVFDAWGANDIKDGLSSEVEEAMLSAKAVAIPMDENDREGLPDESDILAAYNSFLQGKSSVHFGYPYNLMFDFREVMQFLQYSINNLGDPFVPSNYGVHSRQFEVAVIDFFARLWKMQPGAYWGYVTTSGTEGNLHGILLARERFPDGILYTSQETHYSVFKAARYYRMECQSIPTLPMGEINYDILAEAIAENKDKPVIINVNIGTTVKGAVDNLDRILRMLQQLQIPRERYYIHCDGALFALMMPFIDFAPEVSFRKPIDSIAVSGHKMLGSPMPCGIALCRKEHVQNVEQHIDYLNSVDTTIMGSRNGHAALYMWYSLRKKGVEGIKRDVLHCIQTARYLRDKLTEKGLSCRLNDLSSTVCLERPLSNDFIQRWQLACEEDICHVVVMPNVTRSKIDKFVDELIQVTEKHGRIQPVREGSPLMQLSATW